MTELAKAITFECAYRYWAAFCGFPTREVYMLRLLKGR